MAAEAVKYSATGRRKTSVARVILVPGTGKITINKRDVKEFIPLETLRGYLAEPLAVTGNEGKFDLTIRVSGGGLSGQAGAIRLAIARALILLDDSLRSELKGRGMLVRDSRMKERKKTGQPGARKKFQFSKR